MTTYLKTIYCDSIVRGHDHVTLDVPVQLALAVGRPSDDAGGGAWRRREVVAETGGGAGGMSHRHLTGRWINGGDNGDVRVRILGCHGGTMSMRLEGVREWRWTGNWLRYDDAVGGTSPVSGQGDWTALEVDH
jgi:hypothetical protein